MRTKFRVGPVDSVNVRRGQSGEVLLALGPNNVPILRVLNGIIPGGFQIPGKQAVANPFGPGPQALQAGDKQFGFYGIIDESQLVSASTLINQLGISTITVTASEEPQLWGKFAYKGKVLFIPLSSLGAVSWANLYQAGLVYGIDGPGTHRIGSSVNQLRIVTVAEKEMKVRLPRGATTDEIRFNAWPGGGDIELLDQLFDVWQPDLEGLWKTATYSWCQEYVQPGQFPDGRLIRKYQTKGGKGGGTEDRPWIPVLELV